MDVLGAPAPAFLVPASLAKQIVNLHSVVGVLESAPIAEASVPPQHVQRPSIALGVQVQTTIPPVVHQDITFLVQVVSTLAQEYQVTPIVQHAILQLNALLVPQDITFLDCIALTLALEHLIIANVWHAVLQLNVLLVPQDITFLV